MTILAGWCTLLVGIGVGVACWSAVLCVVLLIRESNWSPWKAVRHAARYWWLRARGRCTLCGGLRYSRERSLVGGEVDTCYWCTTQVKMKQQYGAHR